MNPTTETGDGEDDQQCDNRTSAGFDGSTPNISPVDYISGGGDECEVGLMVGSSTIETEVMRENDSTIVQRSQNDEDDEIVRPPMSDDKKYFSLESRGASENRGGDDKLTRGRTDDCDNSTDDEFNTVTAIHEAVQPVGEARNDMNATSTMPSVGTEKNCGNDKVSDGISGTGDESVINEERRYSTHNCGTRTIKVSSDKWVKNNKTGLYSTKKVKVSKLICVYRNGGLESPQKSTPTRTRAANQNLVGRAIKIFGKIEQLKNESSSKHLCERESKV